METHYPGKRNRATSHKTIHKILASARWDGLLIGKA